MFLSLLIPAALAAVPIDIESAIVRFESARAAPAHLAPFAASEDPAVRARTAQALGRLRSPSAIHTIGPLAADSDPTVRKAAAYALSQTPGTRWMTRQRLSVEKDSDVRIQLFFALALQGNGEDISLLLDSIEQPLSRDHPGDEVASAARAIGRLAMRGIRAATNQDVVRRLVEQQRRVDVRVRRGAAFSLARITPSYLPIDTANALIQAAKDESDATAQAWLVRATGKLQEMHTPLAELYTETAKDPDPAVRIATVRAGADAGWIGVAGLLIDDDPEVRIAAVAGIGPVSDLDAMTLLGPIVKAGADVFPPDDLSASVAPKLASAVAALAALDRPQIWAETETARYERVQVGLEPSLSQYMAEDRPVPIRVAAVSIATDANSLLSLALNDPEPSVRTTAATRLLSGPSGAYRALSLLQSSDAMVNVAAFEYLADHPNAKAEGALMAAVRSSESRDVVRSAAHALARLYRGKRRKNAAAAAFVPGLLAHEDAGIRGGGAALARSLGLSDAAKVADEAPIDLEEVHTIRGAVVETIFGPIVLQLFPEDAPLNVWNFALLAEQGYYDGLTFHRVIPDFVVQGGDPRGDGWGGPGHTVPDEINLRPHEVGVLGMALSGPDTGGSQWYVTLSAQPHLDGQYTVFGRVTQGLHVLQSMLPGDRIRKIRIERIAPKSERLAAERASAQASFLALKESMPKIKRKRPQYVGLDETGERPGTDPDRTSGDDSTPDDERVEGKQVEENLDRDLDDAPDYLAPQEEAPPLIETERVEFDSDEAGEEAEDPTSDEPDEPDQPGEEDPGDD